MTRLTRGDLIEAYHGYGAPRESWLVGAEFERLLLKSDGTQVSYAEPGGVSELLSRLAELPEWRPMMEGQTIIGLHGDGCAVTLEPGAQVEFAGRPHRSLSSLVDELSDNTDLFRSHLAALRDDSRLVALGVTPMLSMDEIEWVPKGRYEVMRRYLPQRGAMAEVMMKGTTSFQACYDFSDEADCAKKFDLMLRLAPLTTAMFANSPLFEGEVNGWMSNRGRAWLNTDADRTGFPDAIREGYSHEKWVDYLLDVPMMFYMKGNEWLHAEGRSFRQFLELGIDGQFPTWDDWDLHQTSVFPEVRVKKWIEVRGADAVPNHLALGGIALWKGLLYDDAALESALDITGRLSRATEGELQEACRLGLAAQIGGRPAVELAGELLDLAEGALGRIDPEGLPLLASLKAQIDKGESPAAEVVRKLEASASIEEFLDSVAY